MTTSITDARFTSLHFTPGHLSALLIDPDPETGWGVMPGYDQSLPIPQHLEPPRLDADETLPSLMHPSYPFGRPVTRGRVGKGGKGVGNLLGTVGTGLGGEAGGEGGWGAQIGGGVGGVGGGEALSGGGKWVDGKWRGNGWEEVGLREVLEGETKREVPPGMAGAKRPPSPPSPSMHPSTDPQPRSQHLRNLYSRQRQPAPVPPEDPFDASVPNETFAEGESGEGEGGQGQGGQEQGSGEEGM